MKISKVLFSIALGAISLTSYAQDDTNKDDHTVKITIPEVALLDLEAKDGTSITLAPTAPTEAGLGADFSKAKDETIWINYSSIIGSETEPSRNVSVAITTGSVPGGTALKVTAKDDAEEGEGTVGSPASDAITLSKTGQNLITGIGSAYTGDGVAKGHNLIYKLDAIDGEYDKLDFDESAELVISYTLSDD